MNEYLTENECAAPAVQRSTGIDVLKAALAARHYRLPLPVQAADGSKQGADGAARAQYRNGGVYTLSETGFPEQRSAI